MRKRRKHTNHKFLLQMGEAVRSKRTERALSQEELGRLCGMHRSYITEIEGGSRNLSILTIVKLAEALKLEVWQLLRFEIPNPPESDGTVNGTKKSSGECSLN